MECFVGSRHTLRIETKVWEASYKAFTHGSLDVSREMSGVEV